MEKSDKDEIKDKFWESDLIDIEKTFLKEGQEITDLPSILDDRVPPQSGTLLNRVINLKDYK